MSSGRISERVIKRKLWYDVILWEYIDGKFRGAMSSGRRYRFPRFVDRYYSVMRYLRSWRLGI